MAEATKTSIHREKKATFYHTNTAIPQPEYFVFGNGGHVVDMEKTGSVTLESDLMSTNNTVDIRVGQTVTGDGIQAETTVIAIPTGNSVQLSKTASATFAGQNYLFNGLKPEDPAQTVLSQANPYQVAISNREKEDDYSCTLIGFLEEEQMIGATISEVGVIDTEGDLIAFYHLGPNVKGESEEYEARLKLRE